MTAAGSLLDPLRLGAGAFRPGTEHRCVMDLLCELLGEPRTGYPSCSARPLARVMQVVNDGAAGPAGLLDAAAGWRILDVAMGTVGTAAVGEREAAAWMADVLAGPAGAARWAPEPAARVAGEVAAALRAQAAGEAVPADEWPRLHAWAQKVAWAGRGGVGFAVADAAVYATWRDAVVVGARTAGAAVLVGGDQPELFARAAIARWRDLQGCGSRVRFPSGRLLRQA